MPAAKPFRSELSFASMLVYSPRGESRVSRESQSFIYQLKNDVIVTRGNELESAAQTVARRLREEIDAGRMPDGFADFLGRDVILVPTPGSAMHLDGALWPALELANALISQGFGSRVDMMVSRATPVRKSATARPGERPTLAEHYASMSVKRYGLGPLAPITLVDDVITKGATQLAAATRIRTAFSGAVVRGFAAVRTLGLQREIDRMLAPCIGTIRTVNNEAVRDP